MEKRNENRKARRKKFYQMGLRKLSQLYWREPYDNIAMISPDNFLMCYITKRKADFYLRKNLATQLPDGSIKLLFQPKGPGNKGLAFYLEKRLSICVVCGTDKKITGHHVIPKQFIRMFRDYKIFKDYFANNSHDVVIMCQDCHSKYEEVATLFKYKLLKDSGFDPMYHKKIYYMERTCFGAINSLSKHADKIPLSQKKLLHKYVYEYFQKNFEDLTEQEISQKRIFFNNEKYKPYRNYVKFIYENDQIHQFTIKWRQHFVDSMKPKFLSPLWDINYLNMRG